MTEFTNKIAQWYKKQSQIIKVILPVALIFPLFIPFLGTLYAFLFTVLLILFFNYFLKPKLKSRVARLLLFFIISPIIFIFAMIPSVITSSPFTDTEEPKTVIKESEDEKGKEIIEKEKQEKAEQEKIEKEEADKEKAERDDLERKEREARQEEEAKKESQTVSQKNTIRKAESYLNFSGFSRNGLIKQLEFEGFTTEDSTFAVDNITVDWNEQAAKKAKSYLDFSGFSRTGLIDQLKFEGFTQEQAEYGANTVGL
jgi:hypothetical protein